MNLDEDLQRKVESGAGEGNDADAYRSVFSALDKEPSLKLPSNFSTRVVAAIQAEIARREARKDRWWLALGLIGLIGALGFTLAIVDFSGSAGVFSFLSGYKNLVIFTVAMILTLQVVDRYVFPRISRKA